MTPDKIDTAPERETVTIPLVNLMFEQRNQYLLQLIKDECSPEQVEKIRDTYNRTINMGHEYPMTRAPMCICNRHPWTLDPHNYTTGPGMGEEFDGSAVGYCLASVPRSGSTLLHQVLSRLLEKPMVKTHRLFATMCPLIHFQGVIFVILRHPYDTIYSQMRYKYGGKKVPREEIDIMFEDIPALDAYIRLTESPILRDRLLPPLRNSFYILRYEDYWGKEESLVKDMYKFLRQETAFEGKIDNMTQVPEKTIQELDTIAREVSAPQIAKSLSDGESGAHIGPTKGAPGAGTALDPETKEYIAHTYGRYFQRIGGYTL